MVGRVVCRGFPRCGARLAKWRADRSGSAAIEFAIVALPFLMLLFGTISVSLYYFTTFTVENAVWMASRAIRTGQFQQGQGAYAGYATNEDRKKAFKKALCDKAPAYLDCNKAVVLVQSNNGGFSSIAPPACATNGTLLTKPTLSSTRAAPIPSSWSPCATVELRHEAAVPSAHCHTERRLTADSGLRRIPFRTVPERLMRTLLTMLCEKM